MKIQVTQKHIDDGKAGSCMTCPVALAITEATGYKVKVNQLHIRFIDFYRLYPTPVSVYTFIRLFDETNLKPDPFEFELDLTNIIIGHCEDRIQTSAT